MKKVIVVVVFMSFCFISCKKNKSCEEKNDIVNYSNYYNISLWRPFLDQRSPEDSLLQAKLIELSTLFGDFARNTINASGGMSSDGSLVNPCSKIRIDEKELDLFYNRISILLEGLKEEGHDLRVHEELNKIIKYNFFSSEGSLNSKKIITSNVEIVASRLLLFENICYYFIIRYA